MEAIKIFLNGRPQGVYGITDKDEVTDALLEEFHDDPKTAKYLIESHLEKGLCIIPKSAEPFEWNENIHGPFWPKED